MKFHINKNLLPMKGHFFLYNSGLAPVQPFMPVIAKDLNFSSTAVGVINGFLPFAGMIAKPVFGAIADRFRLHKFVFICFQVLTIVGFFNIQFLPKIEKVSEEKVKLVCGAETNFHVCLKDPNKPPDCLVHDILKESNTNKTVQCSLKCDLSPDLRTELCGPWHVNPKICTEDISGMGSYTHFSHDGGPLKSPPNVSSSTPLDDVKLEFVASVPMKHTLQVADCLYFRVADAQLNDETHHIPNCNRETDTQCKIHCEDSTLSELLKTQKKDDSSDDFVHHYQFWAYLLLATVSWIGMAVVGSVADAVCFVLLGDNPGGYGYQRLWGSVGWGSFAIIAGLIVDAFSVDGKTNYTPAFYMMAVFILGDVICSYNLKYEQTKLSSSIVKNIGKLLKDVWADIFLLWCIFLGLCVGVQWTFLFLHLEKLADCDQKASQKTLLGLVSGVQCFLGEIPSFFAFGWVVKKIGHVHLMTLIPFVIGIRFILYSVLPNPWWVLPVELLQASVGFSFATMASYASIVAPPGTEATVQGLVGAIFEGIGVSLGSYLGGVIFDAYGGRGLYRIFAAIAFVTCVSHGTVHYFLGKNTKLHTKEVTADECASASSPNDTIKPNPKDGEINTNYTSSPCDKEGDI